MPKKRSAPALGEVEKQYLAEAVSLPSYGRFVSAGAQSFVQRVGALKLLEMYPDFYKIQPKASGDTLEELIGHVLEEYIAHLIGKWLGAWGKFLSPKEKYDAFNSVQAQKLIVTAMQYYADEIRTAYPDFLPPPEGEEELYTLRCTVEYLPGGAMWEWHKPGRNSSGNHAARFYPGKELTRRQIEGMRAHHDFTHFMPEQVDQFLIQLILGDFAERFAKDPVKVLPLNEREQESFRVVRSLLVVSSAAPSPEGMHHGTQDGGSPSDEQQEEAVYELEIDITGCQAESCTHHVEIKITESQLLAWGRKVYSQGTIKTSKDFEGALWDAFLVWGEAELDDHTHEFETSYEGDETIQAMVQVLAHHILSETSDQAGEIEDH